MNKAKQRQLVLKSMRKIYYGNTSYRYDWMGYLITDDNKPSYHHIVKREELAEANQPIDATVENGAYLGKRSHEMLHKLELIDHDLYECWNDIFNLIANMKVQPVQDVWDTIFKLREISENTLIEHKKSKSKINK